MTSVSLYRPGILENALGDFDRYFNSFLGGNLFTPALKSMDRMPAVDVQETGNSYIIEAELPGMDEKDIQLRVENNNLTIESRKEESTPKADEKSEKESNYLVRERHHFNGAVSSFSRTFRLPENADSDSITASFKNGVLFVEIKKRAEAQKRVIEISKS